MSATIATTAKRAYGTVVPLVRRLRTWLLYAWVADDHRRWVARRDQLQRQLLEARLQAAFYGEWRAELMNQLVPHPSRPNKAIDFIADRLHRAWPIPEIPPDTKTLEAETGATRISLLNAATLHRRYGSPTEVLGCRDLDGQHTIVARYLDHSHLRSTFHVFTGLSWGYRGEGPHGTLEYLNTFCGGRLQIGHIAGLQSYTGTIDLLDFTRKHSPEVTPEVPAAPVGEI